MRDISQARFNVLAGYCRSPQAVPMSQEHRWLESEDGEIVATVIRDAIDGDFAAMILAQDLRHQFRLEVSEAI